MAFWSSMPLGQCCFTNTSLVNNYFKTIVKSFLTFNIHSCTMYIINNIALWIRHACWLFDHRMQHEHMCSLVNIDKQFDLANHRIAYSH